MYIIPGKVWWRESKEPQSIKEELTTLCGNGPVIQHVLHEPMMYPVDDLVSQGDNEYKIGYKVVSVGANKAYWLSPDDILFETSAVMAAKVLMFGDVRQMKLALAFSEDGSLRGLMLEDHMSLVKDNLVLSEDLAILRDERLPSWMVPGVEVECPQPTGYGSKTLGSLLYAGETRSNYVFWDLKRARLINFVKEEAVFKYEYGNYLYVNNPCFLLANSESTNCMPLDTTTSRPFLIKGQQNPKHKEFGLLAKNLVAGHHLLSTSMLTQLQALFEVSDPVELASSLVSALQVVGAGTGYMYPISIEGDIYFSGVRFEVVKKKLMVHIARTELPEWFSLRWGPELTEVEPLTHYILELEGAYLPKLVSLLADLNKIL
jgi:hypothetical protein